MEKVSILLPTVGRPTLGSTIQSLIDQTYENWEALVVVNNCPEIPVIPDDPRVSVLEVGALANNTGASARNIGFAAAKGDFIGTLDDDDWYEPTFLEAMVPVLRDGEADLVYCRTTLRNRDTHKPYGTWLYPFNADVLPKAGYILSPSILYKRQMLEGYQLHADGKGRNSDWIFYVERSRAGFKFQHVDQLLTNLCVDEGIWRYWAPGGFRALCEADMRGSSELQAARSGESDGTEPVRERPVVVRQRRKRASRGDGELGLPSAEGEQA